MRWSIIRVIWVRELRDQLRDRRTIFMIAVLPILLYPLAGLGIGSFAASLGHKPQVVGVYGDENLPAEPPEEHSPLLIEDDGKLRVAPEYLQDADQPGEPKTLKAAVEIRRLPDPTEPGDAAARKPLDDHSVDLVVIVPKDFASDIQADKRASILLLDRKNDDQSNLANIRFKAILGQWKKVLEEERLRRRGLPAHFDDPFQIEHPPEPPGSPVERANTDLFSLFLRVFPLILVLWSLAGALYPAVDLCAGEKERGTMETLLISPASREEIVWGKFLTIWVFSAATALLNLLSMGLTAWNLSGLMPNDAFHPAVFFWSALLVLPLSAFFSAVSLAVGAYARSSKEGQYYLMPLFLLTLPLIFVTLAPGVELNPLYSMVPVTGVALLLQRLILPDPHSSNAWQTGLYFIPVLAPMVIYSWLALRWAVAQFQREEVLFREAERLDIGLWLRRLFREKEALPTAGQAFFCFGLLMVLRWLSLGFGRDKSMLDFTAVCQLAFTAAPPLFMALLLTTRPRLGLALRIPRWWSWPTAAVLGVLCAPPLDWLTRQVLHQFPELEKLIRENNSLAELLRSQSGGPSAYAVVVFAVLPALCEEIAFRGFMLSGLLRRFRPWAVVFLSSFLYALFQMNVFQFATAFVLGAVLALIALRTGSVAPAMVFHLVYNLSALFAAQALGDPLLGAGLAIGCGAAAAGLLAAMMLLGRRPATAPSLEKAGPEALAAANGAAASDAVRQAPS